MMGVEFTGDWDKLLNPAKLESAMRNHMGDALERAGETLRKNIVKGIRNQEFDFAPLAESTIEQKAKKNQSEKILIAEGDYFSSFTTKKTAWDEVQVGSNHPQGRALEHGYEPRGLPARPHVGPAAEESAEEILDELAEGLATMWRAVVNP